MLTEKQFDPVARAAAETRQTTIDTIKRIHTGAGIQRQFIARDDDFKGIIRTKDLSAADQIKRRELRKELEARPVTRAKRKQCTKDEARVRAQLTETIHRRSGGLPIVAGDVKLCSNCGSACGCK